MKRGQKNLKPKPKRTPDKKSKLTAAKLRHTLLGNRFITGYAIILALFSINIFRAHTQSITHDEALTYRVFASRELKEILRTFHSNNHTLHTALVKISTTELGLSHLSVRLPALFGGLLYLLSAERLCRIFCKDKIGYTLSLLALTTSPFILDFLVVARGYSPASGFFMCAVVMCAWEKNLYGTQRNDSMQAGKYAGVSCLCALSVASNLAFAFVNTCLLATFFIWSCFGGNSGLSKLAVLKRAGVKLVLLAAPGAVLYSILNPGIFNYSSGTMYYGSKSWHEAYQSLIGSLFGASEGIPKLMAIYLPILFLLFIIIGGSIVGQNLWKWKKGRSALDNNAKLWLFVFSIVITTIALHSIAKGAFDVLLPRERTGIFFVPLLILLTAISVESTRDGKFLRILGIPGRICISLAIALFLYSFHVSYFSKWKYDSGSKDIYLVLRDMDRDKVRNGIGIDWTLEPSLNFYRDYYEDSYIPRFSRRKPNRTQNIFVFRYANSKTTKLRMENWDLEVVYRHPISNAIIAAKR